MAKEKRRDRSRVILTTGEFQRPNGTYQYGWTDGNGKRHVIYAKTLDELREKESKISRDKVDGIKSESRFMSVNDMFEKWKELKRGLKDNTFSNYIYMYNTFVHDDFGSKRIANLKKSDVKRFYSILIEDRGLKPATLDCIHTVLHQVFEMAVDDDYIRSNPSNNVIREIKQAHGIKMERRRALTLPEQKLFLSYLSQNNANSHWYPIFAFMLGTGLRAGEFCGLRWEDIDFEKRVITVDHAVVMVRGVKGKTKDELHISCPKTEAGIRTIPIMEPVMEAFKDEFIYGEFRGFPSTTIDGYTDFIFTNQAGNVYTCTRLDLELRNIVKAYNKREDKIAEAENREPVYLPNFSCHILRHTFCTRLCENDVNIKVIQTVMGHANIKITMDIYAEVSAEKQRREIERMATELDVF